MLLVESAMDPRNECRLARLRSAPARQAETAYNCRASVTDAFLNIQ